MKEIVKRLVIAVAVAVGIVAFAAPGVASAHAILDSSDPVSSAVLATSPTQITLTFNEEIESKLSSIRLFDANQREVEIDKTQRSAANQNTAFASVPQLKNGVYIVVWRVVSADGHPVSGAFPFEIGNASSGNAQSLLTEVMKGLNSTSNLGNPLAFARLLSFLGAIVLIGMVSVTWGSSLVRTQRTIRIMRLSALALGAGSLMVLLLHGPYASGLSWGQIFNGNLIDDVLHTRLGVAVLIRTAVAFEWLLITYFVSREDATLWKNTAVFTAFITIATFAISGHPSAAGNEPLFVTIDAVHLLAIALWVGGVVGLALLSGTEDLVDETSRFSRIATYAMPVAIGSGVVQSLHLLPSLNSLTSTEYGRLLLLKTFLVVVTVGIGTLARKKLKANSSVSIRSHLRREAVIAVIIVAITSLLVGTSPTKASDSATKVFSVTMVQQDVVADFTVSPTKVGPAEVHAIFTPPGGNLHPVVAMKLVLSLPSRKIPNIPVNLIQIGPNHWSGIVELPFAGEWTMQARVSPTKTETLLYSTKVKVAG
jgi:copper transport protein